ncbi:DNA polymerase IV [Sinomonas sp. ASV322]|uniref:DNA polymerase IV n=1 Tax=Sinomonas sp. ASV322 TaxID=3041920 RepID=UPI0027DD729D|nr:DNA polymerase IV [Sinomonas sp. ASV322]MDQ4500795.1 DNA polymerase IV [Sinomonas sp. ASV322]
MDDRGAGGGWPDAEPLDSLRRRGILHVDMDAFFVGVEQRERPELRGQMVIVGFPSERSVVLSASYEARAYGVRSAMPMATALRACPRAIVVEPRHTLYYEVSRELMALFGEFTDLVEPLSVDEAFLDVSGAVRRLGPPERIAAAVKAEVRSRLGLTASVGVAATKFVAKIASARSKPDGLLVIRPEETVPYLHSLPVGALWGIGGKTAEVLARLGIHTVEDLAHTPDSTLQRMLGAPGLHAKALSWGIDSRRVTPHREEKSVGAEETFASDVVDDEVLKRELLRLSHRVAARLRAAGLEAGTVALKLRYADFSTLSRSRAVTVPADSAHVLYREGVRLLAGIGPRPQSVRLIGLRGERLSRSGGAVQLSLEPGEDNWRTAEKTIDAVSARFGRSSLRPASLLGEAAERRRPSPPGEPPEPPV